MSRPTRWRLAALPVAAGIVFMGPTTAGAHEPRTSGGFRFVVGWVDEPAYTGLQNSVQVIVSEANGSAVTDIGDSLTLEVSKGSERITLALEAAFQEGAGTPGDYRARMTPTRPGTYVVRLVGSIRGQTVDESFTSGSTTFNDVENARTIQFPARDPSPGDLAARLDRQLPRLEQGLRAAAERARKVAVVAVAVATFSLVVTGLALVAVRRRCRSREPGPTDAVNETPPVQAETLHR